MKLSLKCLAVALTLGNLTFLGDIAKLLTNVDLSYNQPGTAPGCMSEPNDFDCTGVMKNFGIPFVGSKTPKQTFFSVK